MKHTTVELLSPQTLRALSVLSPLRFIAAYLGDVACIAAGVALWRYCGSTWYYYPVLLVWIASRQHAIGTLIHEAAHYRFLANRKWADYIVNIFLAYPLFIDVKTYRAHHLTHHQHLNTLLDPDWAYRNAHYKDMVPAPKSQILLHLFKSACGYSLIENALFLKSVVQANQNTLSSRRSSGRYLKALMYVSVFSALIVSGFTFELLLFWILPFMTAFMFFLEMRSLGEHVGLSSTDALGGSRFVEANWIERFIFAPHNVGYHAHHHVFPSVPFHRLAELDRLLRKNPEFSDSLKQSRSYLFGKKSLLEELSQRKKA